MRDSLYEQYDVNGNVFVLFSVCRISMLSVARLYTVYVRVKLYSK